MDEFTHWRDSARTPRIFILDYRAVIPFLFLLFSPTSLVLYAFILVVIMTAFFSILEYFGFTYSIFLRWLRSSFISGRYKTARSWWN
ncbi:MAG: IcmT/TraK family protein [Gammaproteobacteria bacterium]|nr:IcmT/TraK family protein [Gammaproteobacteria bacterium]